MKKPNLSFINGYNAILAALLGLLGFTNYGCSQEYGSPPPKPEYGSPHADYIIKGKVVEKNSENAIKNIKINYYNPYSEVQNNENAAFSDEQGNFILPKITDFAFLDSIPIIVSDVDGVEDGLFLPDTIKIRVDDGEKTKEGDRWYVGEYTKTVIIELTKIDE
jgi:putative lipoprotein (rSAM/lipoprotein system)